MNLKAVQSSNSAHRIPCSQSRAQKPAAFQESQWNQQPRVILDKYDFNKCWKIRKLQALGSCDFYHTEFPGESGRRASNVSSFPSESWKKVSVEETFSCQVLLCIKCIHLLEQGTKLIWKQREESVATLAEDKVYKLAQGSSKSTIRETSDTEKCVLATCLIVISMKNWNHTSMGLSFPHSPEGGSC